MTEHTDNEELRRLVLEKRRTGKLPPAVTPHAWAGRGSGERCVLCESPIEIQQIEYEVELRAIGAEHVLRFHEICYRLWTEA